MSYAGLVARCSHDRGIRMIGARLDIAGLLTGILPDDFAVREEVDVRAHLSTQASQIRSLMGQPLRYAEVRYNGPGESRLALKRGQTRRSFLFIIDVWYEYTQPTSQAAWDDLIEGDGGIIPTFAAQPRLDHAQLDSLQDVSVRIEVMDATAQMYSHRLTATVTAKQT